LLKQYIQSIYAHIDGLAARGYQDNEKLKTLDVVLMFMPIEGAFSLAMQEDPGLQSYAWNKRIALISPSTLFVTMRTVAAAWRNDMQNKNAIEIARQGGNLYDKIVGFIDIMQDLGGKIGVAQKTYEKAFENLTTGQGNILRRTESLRELGVKTTKKMPAGLVADDTDDIKKVESA
jgi:DNA recombination protein RmuC